jgi:DNA recombination-dependent growth factor C
MTITLMDIIKQKHHPEQFKAEQEAEAKIFAETLAFVEGMKSALEEVQKSKAQPLFVSDDSAKGFKPANK